jgi:ubiquitin-conjugating enzyme E2 M
MLILCQSVGPDVSDLTELDLPPTMKTDFPDPANLLHFKIILNPDEGALDAGFG